MAKSYERSRTTINDLGYDIFENIMERLPLKSFMSAADVSRRWKKDCTRILSYPRFSSSVSFNPILEGAVDEVVDKVLSKPISPQFVLVSVCPCFILKDVLRLIQDKLGSDIPIILNVVEGLIGRDALTNDFNEVQWQALKEVSGGIMLTVGCLPGLKARVIPLLRRKFQGDQSLLLDQFVTDIREATLADSDCTSPAGIILFADGRRDIEPVLQKIGCAFPEDTVVVGDGSSRELMCGSYNWPKNSPYTPVAIALVLTKDTSQPLDFGQTQFRVMVSTATSPVGTMKKSSCVVFGGFVFCSKYRAQSSDNSTFLTSFPEVNFGGIYCSKEVGNGILHYCSCVYLLIFRPLIGK
ncbi:PREDICTED: F-box/LRR-repeat protein At5g63520-like [Erythranthe guttata]|uniref:F-box/LRR-repeat protein At5g63520-like n=1 Tax=Erythranthe guttata TaxID=4155 RepID=UPI00064DDC2D|nr:PREDICTED: F-box/LRR-repeat protein At5g63520-like [Erythranthe guttata]|eukprot:XP_012837728.1 PREDICTED: F-box/LRR-repeat protein At5g63520-like [Erythranthe guttata]